MNQIPFGIFMKFANKGVHHWVFRIIGNALTLYIIYAQKQVMGLRESSRSYIGLPGFPDK